MKNNYKAQIRNYALINVNIVMNMYSSAMIYTVVIILHPFAYFFLLFLMFFLSSFSSSLS